MHPTALSEGETRSIKVGEALSLATVILVFTVVVLAIAGYKIFKSKKANVTTPSGYKFEWSM